MDIGSRIRKLRLSHSMTQEQLGQKLGLSAQAISKWESGTNMPDIQMLPELAVIFGVSIDDLFAMTDESRMERISNRIRDARFLTAQEFCQYEQYLTECRRKEPLASQASLLLARLYIKRSEEYRILAAPLAREALTASPGRKDAHNAVFDAEGGAYRDWNTTNHRDLIELYKEITDTHPEDIRNYFWLLNLLIADGRTAEARQYAQAMRLVAHSYHYELYMGYICRAECDLPGAMDWWQKMLERSPDSWIVYAEMGSALAKLGQYDEAAKYYKQAMPLRPKPRFTDCEDALTQIYLIQGNLPEAIAMQKQMLSVIKEDWCAEGESVDQIKRKIVQLESMQ